MKLRTAGIYFLLMLTALTALVFTSDRPVTSQSRERRAEPTPAQRISTDRDADKAPAEVVKVDVDLVTIDALVLEKKTARIVGGLQKQDFQIYEDGARQEITHFSQDSLPLSVLFLIDRGGCLDPFGDKVHRAAREAIERLKPADEVAVMTYHDTTRLLQGFTKNRILIEDALNRVPMHDEEADHCLNNLFFDAANYTMSAGNPMGRRVIVVITGVTRNFDCPNGPSGRLAARQIYESGSVVCAIIPKEMGQGLENGVMVWATRMGKLGGAPSMDVENLANETGGEILSDKPENLDTTFQTLMDHLRSRYNLAFVSTNKKRDGTTRKLKIDAQPPAAKSQQKLVVKARRSYVAPRS
ncbi:MAG TPA: VWA domain-containing protein [Pyrinomonadaceae bacterium]|jgi:Ca-activated chloride channel family protein|nr:VWA domain-containing protein [Pyrinomonadaceae bacterium]